MNPISTAIERRCQLWDYLEEEEQDHYLSADGMFLDVCEVRSLLMGLHDGRVHFQERFFILGSFEISDEDPFMVDILRDLLLETIGDDWKAKVVTHHVAYRVLENPDSGEWKDFVFEMHSAPRLIDGSNRSLSAVNILGLGGGVKSSAIRVKMYPTSKVSFVSPCGTLQYNTNYYIKISPMLNASVNWPCAIGIENHILVAIYTRIWAWEQPDTITAADRSKFSAFSRCMQKRLPEDIRQKIYVFLCEGPESLQEAVRNGGRNF